MALTYEQELLHRLTHYMNRQYLDDKSKEEAAQLAAEMKEKGILNDWFKKRLKELKVTI